MSAIFRLSIRLDIKPSKFNLISNNLKLLRQHRLDPYYSKYIEKPLSTFERNGYPTVHRSLAQSTCLITKLSKDGRIFEARRVFDEMREPDVVAWTTIISAYLKYGWIKEARELFERADSKKNVVTWTSMVGGYIKANDILEAEKLFLKMPHKNVISWNTMIDGYAQMGRIDSACHLFETMPERNVVSWNTLIGALGQCGRVDEGKRLFDQMPIRDVISWTAMIAGLSKSGRIDEAKALFDKMPERNVVSWNAMITGYAQNSRIDEAFSLFMTMPERDVPSYNTMITGLVQNGDLIRAKKLFNEMPNKNVVSWTTMITGYVQNGENEEALKFFSKMQAFGKIRPNQGTFVSTLGACSNLAGLSEGKQIHLTITKSVYQYNPNVISALINMYSKCGELVLAREIFNDSQISHRDIISWNCMIAAYAHHGLAREAISLYEEMLKLQFKPDDVTYVGMLAACSHAGLVEEGLKYFDELAKDRSIEVREDHYACLIDLCGRAGRLEEAFNLIKLVPLVESSACVWGALLAGCNFHVNESIGKLAAKELLEVEPENAGTYLLLSNIYASSGKWREAAKVRLKMKDRGLKKQPGCSWIEVGNRIHVFVVGDKSQRQSKAIYSLLLDLHLKMEKPGLVLEARENG